MTFINQLASLPFPSFLLTPEKLIFRMQGGRTGDSQSVMVTCTMADSNGAAKTVALQGYTFTQKQIDAFALTPP